MRTSNGKCRSFVEQLKPFSANNLSGVKSGGDLYVVYSYGWYPIFVHKNSQWYENSDKYSVTTSKQTSQSRPYNGGEIVKKTHNELKAML